MSSKGNARVACWTARMGIRKRSKSIPQCPAWPLAVRPARLARPGAESQRLENRESFQVLGVGKEVESLERAEAE
jgi:hypothetical protein